MAVWTLVSTPVLSRAACRLRAFMHVASILHTRSVNRVWMRDGRVPHFLDVTQAANIASYIEVAVPTQCSLLMCDQDRPAAPVKVTSDYVRSAVWQHSDACTPKRQRLQSLACCTDPFIGPSEVIAPTNNKRHLHSLGHYSSHFTCYKSQDLRHKVNCHLHQGVCMNLQ